MFEVSVCEPFEAWYATLAEPDAETVTSAIDVLAELGPALGPPQSSELLLWYDGTGSGPLTPRQEAQLRRGFEPKALANTPAAGAPGWVELAGWKQRLLGLFDSQRFRSRLARLDPEAAARALDAIEHVRTLLSKERRKASFNLPVDALAALDPAISAALAAAGLEISNLDLHAPGLRELRVSCTGKPCRVLYGIEPKRQHILVILGEPLDRAYYGDSVRQAEQRWREHLAKSAESEPLAP